MQTPNTPSTPALPLQLCVHRYYSRAEDPAFQQLLVVWNQVAPILAAAPAGTIAKVDSESLFVAPVDGALAMFLSADLSPTASTATSSGLRISTASAPMNLLSYRAPWSAGWLRRRTTRPAPRLTLQTCSPLTTGRRERHVNDGGRASA